jgi:hypothetical protein
MRPHSIALLVACALLGVAGCGKKSTPPVDEGPPAIHGQINTDFYRIPRGETRQVDGDLTILATKEIHIDGTLLLPPGKRVVLLAPDSVLIGGSIQASGGPALQKMSPGRMDGLAGSSVTTPCVVLLTRVARVTGDLALPAGTSFYAVALVPTPVTDTLSPAVTVSGSITTSAVDARSLAESGGSSGAIEIGSEAALAAYVPSGSAYAAIKPGRVTVPGILRTGAGGRGFDDRTGVVDVSARTLTLAATDAGNAGDIRIRAAAAIDLSSSQIEAGNGGGGGHAGSSGLRAQDGTARGEGGFSFSATSGSGGRGGAMDMVAPEVTGAIPAPGAHGMAGNIRGAAGNGGPGGAGGNAILHVGRSRESEGLGLARPGRLGSGASAPALEAAGDTIQIAAGGNGGAADGALIGGGTGGWVRIEPKSDSASVLVADFRNYGNGGAGYSGCAVLPYVVGTAGGNAGRAPGDTLTILRPATVDVVRHSFVASFAGGAGGDGITAARGGRSGWAEVNGTRIKIVDDGRSGVACLGFDPGVYYPLVPGNRYTYHAVEGANSYDFEMVTGTSTHPPILPQMVLIDGKRARDELIGRGAAVGLQEYGVDYYDESEQVIREVRYTPPFRIRQNLPVDDPDRLTSSILTTEGGLTDTTSVTRTVTLVGFETITVPAGEYADCAHVQVVSDYEDQGIDTSDAWYAAGVGMVKRTSATESRELLTFTPINP